MRELEWKYAMKLWAAFMVLCISSAAAFALSALEDMEAQKKLQEWERQLDKIELQIERTDEITVEEQRIWQAQFADIRAKATEVEDKAGEALRSEKSVLDALGPAPEEGEQETDSVKQKREELNQSISEIDGVIKKSALTKARIDEIKTIIDSRKQQEIRSKLLSQSLMLVDATQWPPLAEELAAFIAGYNQYYALVYLLVGFAALIFISKHITAYLNRFFEHAAHIRLNQLLSRKRIFVVSAAMYLVFLLRIGAISFTDYPLIEDALQATASLCLSLMLFGILGKFEFVDHTVRQRFLGEQKRSYHNLYNGVKKLIRFVLILIPVASLVGYINIALYLSFNIALTISAILLFVLLRYASIALSRHFSHKPEEDEKELSPLAVSIVEPILALFCILLILFFWGMTTEDITSWFTEVKSGIKLGDITIDPINIGLAILLFIILGFVTKIIQWFLSNRVFQYTSLDSGIRDAIMAITGYVGVTLSLLVAMGVIGLDMSNLAIVAGALSVGIGFGLQAIFNNFVSGLILLFERPVKVGDWVIVGENSGIIKKIRVRSTEIETFWNSSVIVPNSQLISETVTNWTLHDRAGRVDIAVGVAYGSDTEKVKNVLLQVAKEHPQVLDYPETRVIFMEFGDSSLNFELRAFIDNIRDVFGVSSDLRFAVDKAFRENNIEIPFPQRDIHIRSSEPIPVRIDGADKKDK